MNYATVDDMIARFSERELIQLTDRENNAVIDLARVETALGDAHALVDGAVGRVYRMPLRGCAMPATVPGADTVYAAPPQLKRLTCDIARYYLYDQVAPEHEVYIRFKQASAELMAIANGNSELACLWGGSAGDLVGADAQQGAEVVYGFSPRQITDDSMRGFA